MCEDDMKVCEPGRNMKICSVFTYMEQRDDLF